MTDKVVIYDYATWIALYPEFTLCSSAQGQAWFNRSTLYFWNNVCNPVWGALSNDYAIFEQLVYMVTSHIAWLSAARDAAGNPSASGTTPASSIVGRINSASEGSVSVGSEWKDSGSPSEAWFIQTKYGAEFWAATAQFRTMQYVANPVMVGGTVRPYGPANFPGRPRVV